MDRRPDGKGGGTKGELGSTHLATGHGLQPHGTRQFKLSNDPLVGKLRDVIGLYVDPRTHAIVLSNDSRFGRLIAHGADCR